MKPTGKYLFRSALIVSLLLFYFPSAYAVDFLLPQDVKVGKGPIHTTVADINRDGHLDFVVANSLSNYISILWGWGDGTFSPAQNIQAINGPYYSTIADFNHDNNLDIAVANFENDANLNNISVILGEGNGSFELQRKFSVGTFQPQLTSIGTADFDEDGNLDLAVVNYSQNLVHVLSGDGTGNFLESVDIETGTAPIDIATMDIDSDGHADLIVSIRGKNAISIFGGRGDGSFKESVNFSTGYEPRAVNVKDVNNDGAIDLVTANRNDTSVLLGLNLLSFAPPINSNIGGRALSFAVADLDSDNALDIAVPRRFSDTVDIAVGDKSGIFNLDKSINTGIRPSGVSTGDFNEDGQPDLVVANTSYITAPTNNTISILLNNSLLKVLIDVKPGDKESCINLKSQGSIPVAILSTENFDILDVDTKSLKLTQASIVIKSNGKPQADFEDINDDGHLDLIAHFNNQDLRLTGVEKEIFLTGVLKTGQPIRGSDKICIINKNLLTLFFSNFIGGFFSLLNNFI